MCDTFLWDLGFVVCVDKFLKALAKAKIAKHMKRMSGVNILVNFVDLKMLK